MFRLWLRECERELERFLRLREPESDAERLQRRDVGLLSRDLERCCLRGEVESAFLRSDLEAERLLRFCVELRGLDRSWLCDFTGGGERMREVLG